MSDENNAPKLRECPFCGGEAYVTSYATRRAVFHVVKCGRCDAQGHSAFDTYDAVMSWNIRQEKAND